MPVQDAIEKTIGSFELYQKFVIVFISIMNIFAAYHQLGIVYLAPKIKFTCESTSTKVCPCSDPIYDTGKFHSTIVDNWNLICEDKILISLTQAFVQLGVLIGRIVFSLFFYRCGPRNVLIVSVAFQMLLSSTIPFISQFSLFLCLRLVLGATVGGALVSGFAIISEFVGREHMDAAIIIYQIPYSIGHIAISLFAYFFRDFRHFLFYTVLSDCVLALYWFLPPTPRWLINKNNNKRALEVLTAIAKTNELATENIAATIENYEPQLESLLQIKRSYGAMFRSPRIRKCVLVMSMLWFSSNCCFFGLAQYINQIKGNLFINVTVCGCSCLIGSLLSLTLLRKVNRRILCVVLNLITATCLLVMAFVGNQVVNLVGSTLTTACNSMLMIIEFIYCYELFPVVLTTVALQFTTAVAGLGSVVAPFVLNAEDIERWLMPVIFFIPPSIAALVTFFLPDTRGAPVTRSVEEGERYIKYPDNFNYSSNSIAAYTVSVVTSRSTSTY